MLQLFHVETCQYACSRLGETTKIDTYRANYSEPREEYPLDAQIPFGQTRTKMVCAGVNRCGAMRAEPDGTMEFDPFFCPALAILQLKHTLRDVSHPVDDAQQIVGRERRERIL